jgi:hypothetical protein
MTDLPCPLPQVEEALLPFIKTRQETLVVRQTLSSLLLEQVGREVPITQLILGAPTPPDLQSRPTKSDGLYRQYSQALAAHRRAQAQYEEVKSDLDYLREQGAASRENSARDSDGGPRDYVKLLWQRRQHGKVQIVQTALSRLLEVEAQPAEVDVKSFVREKLGPPPDPPTMDVDQEQTESKVESLVFRFKKELIAAKSRVEDANAEKTKAEERVASLPKVPLRAQLLALDRTREELVAWMESELGKISEDSEQSVLETGPHTHGEGYSKDQVDSQVQELYGRYVAARQSLLNNVQAVVHESQVSPPKVSHSRRSSVQPLPKNDPAEKALSSADLLPFLPALLQSSRDEAALLQQTTFLRRQLNLASSETKKTVQRLAGESHLVGPDASDTDAWEAAAEESAKKTEAFVKEHVNTGTEALQSGRDALASLQAKRSALAHLKGTL